MSIITDAEQKVVDALKKQIVVLHSDVQAALVREISWIERNIWSYTFAVLVIGFVLGWGL